jgi:hypothetical protein
MEGLARGARTLGRPDTLAKPSEKPLSKNAKLTPPPPTPTPLYRLLPIHIVILAKQWIQFIQTVRAEPKEMAS